MANSPAPTDPVLILGGGVHGAAIARELVLNGVPVVLADAFDLASGATSKSSRLIHGGLRYLEYGDLKLVHESLEERRRNLVLAPHLVRPLKLFIPVSERWTGLMRSAVGFLGLQRTAAGQWLAATRPGRGYWPVRLGLTMYDWLSGDQALAHSDSQPVGTPGTPRVDPRRYRELLAYYDAQMLYPERLVFALLTEARLHAGDHQLPFRVLPYATLSWDGDRVRIVSESTAEPTEFQPALIINASGASGDVVLRELNVPSPELFGGTKGSHLVTWHAELKDALAGHAVYAEAADGRLIFILPFGDAVLIGTTDETYRGRPEEAIASEAEIDYLLRLVEEVFAIRLTRSDVTLHYAGVRPLPRSNGGSNAAISRDHALLWFQHRGIPVLTLVGGKLTTWRSLAEEATGKTLERLGRLRIALTRERPVLGGANPPEGLLPGPVLWERWAREFDVEPSEIAALWPLYGTEIPRVLAAADGGSSRAIRDSPWSSAVVRTVIRVEWVTRLEDLVERRLMSIFGRILTRRTLTDLAECLVACGRLRADDMESEVARVVARLQTYYGRIVE